MATYPMRLPLGARLFCEDGSSYWVERFIGAGGTAQVFTVRDQRGRRLAAKVLSDHRFEVNEEMRARFEREGRTLAKVRSTNIIGFTAMTRWSDEPIMLLEYAEGGSVAGLLERLSTPLPARVSLRWLREALQGLAVMHRANIVHRDISPKNLLIRVDGAVLIADFGTVRHVDDVTLTQEEAALGSLIYISRQQFEAPRKATARDDVYSLGQIAWQLFAGQRPIGNAPPLDNLRPDLSPRLVAFIERMRHHDDAERPADAGVALAELEQLRDLLVKPALRRTSSRPGEPVHNELSASVMAIQARQMDRLEKIARSRGSTDVVWALDLLVEQLGPMRFQDAGANGTGEVRKSPKGFPSWLSSGSVRMSMADGEELRLMTLTNRITGRTLTYDLDEPHVIQDLPWREVLRELRHLDGWDIKERATLFDVFSDAQFTSGMPCAVCWRTTANSVRLMRYTDSDGQAQLFRAGTCSHDGPGDEHLCCVCGAPFRRAMSRDEYGPYEAVGCACPSLAFDLEYGEEPWNEGTLLSDSEAVEIFERE